jgi:hypothetical protein
MTVTQTFAPFVVIKNDEGKAVDAKPADDLAAEMLIKAYVPEYPDYVTFDEAYNLALSRDEEAANDLEASIMANLDSEEDPTEDEAAIHAVNMLLESAALADQAEAAEEAAGL